MAFCLARSGQWEPAFQVMCEVMPEAQARYLMARVLEHQNQPDPEREAERDHREGGGRLARRGAGDADDRVAGSQGRREIFGAGDLSRLLPADPDQPGNQQRKQAAHRRDDAEQRPDGGPVVGASLVVESHRLAWGSRVVDRAGGRGLWIANQLCDLVQVRSGAAGTTVRLHARLP